MAERFEEQPEPVTLGNYFYADILIGLLRAQSKTQKAQTMTDAYCNGIEKLKGDFRGGPKAGGYTAAKGTCLLYRGEYEQALPYLKEYFLEKNGLLGAWTIFENPAFEEAMQRPGYQKVHQQVQAALARQRENVIVYLNKEGDWKAKWDK